MFPPDADAHGSGSRRGGQQGAEEAYAAFARCTRAAREDALVGAVADIVWRCGGGRGAVLCARRGGPAGQRTSSYKPNGVTELLSLAGGARRRSCASSPGGSPGPLAPFDANRQT